MTPEHPWVDRLTDLMPEPDSGWTLISTHDLPYTLRVNTRRITQYQTECIVIRRQGAAQILESANESLAAPLQSIGRLKAAEVEAITSQPSDAKQERFALTLRGLSVNVQLAKGDYVYLIEPQQRAEANLEDYRVVVEDILWEAETQTSEVIVSASVMGKLHPYTQALPTPSEASPLYLYSTASDIWSPRLVALLNQDESTNVGCSWLGERLAFLWQLGTTTALQAPPETPLKVHAPELYLYAPHLLPQQPPSSAWHTTAEPPPDPSQQEAIQLALSRVVTCLQGPPGTGKSQTIAALIDEFAHRFKARTGRKPRILMMAFSYAALTVVLDKVAGHRDAAKQPTRAAQMRRVFARSQGRDPVALSSGAVVHDLVCKSKWFEWNGAPPPKATSLASLLEPLPDEAGVIVFAGAFQLCNLGAPSKVKGKGGGKGGARFAWLPDSFGFDLIIVDEASQLPTHQFLSALTLTKPFEVGVMVDKAKQPQWPVHAPRDVERLKLTEPLTLEQCTQVVVVGDHNQLPPVQPIKAPAKLKVILDSLFRFYVEGHRLPSRQLQVNYRSHPQIVACTQRLGLYEALSAYHAKKPLDLIRKPPKNLGETLRFILDPQRVVGVLIHQQQFETSVSELEARIVAQIVVAFWRQQGVKGAEDERRFWSKEVGVVSPHNAQGRLITRLIHQGLTTPARITYLDDAELMQRLRETVYSVEKFQGSDRTFIISSVAVSSTAQLSGEEEFIYNLNRFNVLTSRAKQKMLLVCSESYLTYVPRDRDVMGYASRVRDYAFAFCNAQRVVSDLIPDVALAYRWRED